MMRVRWSAGTAAVVAMLILAFASSASAAQTDLCKVEESPCPLASRWEQGVNVEAKAEPLKLLTGVGNVECASSTLKGPLGAGGTPQVVALESFVFAECKIGTRACTVEAVGLGGIDLLRTNFNLGEGTFLNTEIKVTCNPIFINCIYGGEFKLHLLGKNGAEPAKLTASEVAIAKLAGVICPVGANKLDATFTIATPAPVYVME